MIDMGRMRTVRVDPRAKTARADAGATWGDFNYATHAFGLATTGGIISTTGVSRVTLGGGIGYLARGSGLTIDNLISADVVTADGKFLVASERENEGPVLGIARWGWELRRRHLVRVSPPGGRPGLCRTDLLQPGGLPPPCFGCSMSSSRDAPEEFGGFPGFQIAPPQRFIPENRHGDTLCLVVVHWAGPSSTKPSESSNRSEMSRPSLRTGPGRCPIRR